MLETNFSQNFAEMGLEDHGDYCYGYQDQYSAVKYMQFCTKNGSHDVPIFGIFVRNPEDEISTEDLLEGYRYAGYVSGSYQFVGNNILAQTIRDSITSAGQVIFREHPILIPNLTGFMNEMIIEHPTNVNQIGTIRPQINLLNSYNGSSMAKVCFGFSIYDDSAIDVRSGFAFEHKMITLKQIHVQTAQTLMTGAVTGYVDIFSNNITDLITQNFETPIEEEDAMKVLAMIDKSGIGKNRSSAINEFITAIENKTSWNIFHAITRFSTMENNLNIKKILDNVAESVLTVPGQMIDAIEEFNTNIAQQLAA